MKCNGMSIGFDGRRSNGNVDWRIWKTRRVRLDWIATAISKFFCGVPLQTRHKQSFQLCWVGPCSGSIIYHFKWTVFTYLKGWRHPPDPMLSTTQYSISPQADLPWHWVNIQSATAWSDIASYTIFNKPSGWPTLTLSEYSVSIHLIRRYNWHNIW
jgi:hypothetical protein